MGQILHGSARTRAAGRRAIQQSQESIDKLSECYHLNPKARGKWKKWTHVHDAPMGLNQPRSTILTLEEEALIVTFRQHTLLPLDDFLYTLQATVPQLTCSALHRCLKRHGINRLPEMTGDKPQKKRFKSYPIGYFRIDIAEVRTDEGKLHLFVAIACVSMFAYAKLYTDVSKVIAAQFLHHLIAVGPYKIHTVLTPVS